MCAQRHASKQSKYCDKTITTSLFVGSSSALNSAKSLNGLKAPVKIVLASSSFSLMNVSLNLLMGLSGLLLDKALISLWSC